jgi:CMP-N,N'-diacetyllegionaminic acid synthase
MRIAAVIPARGGSKRLKKKNIYPIWGKPMIYWAIAACKESKYDIEPWVSTEDPEIARVSRECGAKIINRDIKLADDKTYKQAVIRGAAREINRRHGPQDIYISLQANSPEIQSHHLDAAIDVFLKHDRDEIFSVDGNFMQNAAFRIFRGNYVFQQDLSTNCGVFVCDLHDIHTLEDVQLLEQRTEGCSHC